MVENCNLLFQIGRNACIGQNLFQKVPPEISTQQREMGSVTELVYNFIFNLVIKKFQVMEKFKA